MSRISELNLRKKYDFQSDVLDIIIGGQSTIDSTTAFQVLSLEEADLFIKSYGYDLENPIEKAEVLGNFHEALNFIRKNFLQAENPDGLKLEIPRKILELTDVRELFLMIAPTATSPSPTTPDGLKSNMQLWACSILKVMHTIAHIDKDLRSSYFADIQKQIFDRFYKSIHRDPDGKLFLGEKADDPARVDLVAFETKPKKSRDSIILKLLHKSENVAEDIFDRVGIRFVTHSPLGALQVIKYLKDKMIVMAPNIKPSRSRNTLVYIEGFRTQLDQLLNEVEKNDIPPLHPNSEEFNAETFLQKFEEQVDQITQPTSTNLDNPHSSEHYRAIQFTCRQLIKLRNPLYDDLKELKALVKAKPVEDDVLKTIDRIDLKYIQREIRFFYPFEVQVVDVKSAEENEKGKSAHSEYKRSQIQAAMKRVMGVLADEFR